MDNDGLPHTLEHLIFLGSEDYPYKEVLDLLANRALADRCLSQKIVATLYKNILRAGPTRGRTRITRVTPCTRQVQAAFFIFFPSILITFFIPTSGLRRFIFFFIIQ